MPGLRAIDGGPVAWGLGQGVGDPMGRGRGTGGVGPSGHVGRGLGNGRAGRRLSWAGVATPKNAAEPKRHDPPPPRRGASPPPPHIPSVAGLPRSGQGGGGAAWAPPFVTRATAGAKRPNGRQCLRRMPHPPGVGGGAGVTWYRSVVCFWSRGSPGAPRGRSAGPRRRAAERIVRHQELPLCRPLPGNVCHRGEEGYKWGGNISGGGGGGLLVCGEGGGISGGGGV